MSKGNKILIVDDEMDSLSKLYINLLLKDFRVEATVDADEIIPRIIRFQPEVVILNNDLPGLDGIAVCAAVKENQNIPVVLLLEKTSTTPARLDGCKPMRFFTNQLM